MFCQRDDQTPARLKAEWQQDDVWHDIRTETLTAHVAL